jgi:hypothetical protein
VKGRSLARWLVVVAATRVVGCTYATSAVHVPESLPGFGAGELALGNVDVIRSKGDIDARTAGDVCGEVEDILGRAVQSHAATAAGDSGARVDVSVRIDGQDDFIADAGYYDGCGAMPLLIFAPGGTMTENDRVSVSLVVRSRAGVYEGHGFGDRNGSLYVGARRRALAVALDRALADAAAHGPRVTASR